MSRGELAAIVRGIAPAIRTSIAVALETLAARVAVLETREPVPGPAGKDGINGKDGAPGPDGVQGLDGRNGIDGVSGKDGRDGVNGKDGAAGLAGDRGLDGRDGRDGKDGIHGRDGIDGKAGDRGVAGRDGIDAFDLDVTHDGERTFTFAWTVHDPIDGDRIETRSFVVPCVIYRGVWQEHQPYAKGDEVTWSGSQWIARDATTGARPGLAVEASRVWTLASKAGRDGKPGVNGKDGRDGKDGADGKDYGRY